MAPTRRELLAGAAALLAAGCAPAYARPKKPNPHWTSISPTSSPSPSPSVTGTVVRPTITPSPDQSGGALTHGYYLTDGDVGPRIGLAAFSGTHFPSSNTTYTGLDVGDIVTGSAEDVVYEDCRIRGGFSTDPFNPDSRPDRLVFRHCLFEPTVESVGGTGGNVCYTMYRCRYKGWQRGPTCDRDVTIDECKISDLMLDVPPETHRGIIGNSNGGINGQLVRKCWLASTPNAGGWSGILLWYNGSAADPQNGSNLLCEDTFFFGGEGAGVIFGDNFNEGGTMTNCVIRRAVFGRSLYADCCFQGRGYGSGVPGGVQSGSVWDSCRYDTPTGPNATAPFQMETEIAV